MQSATVPMKSPTRRVVITGLSVVSPLGNSIDAFWSAVRAGQTGVHRMEPFAGAPAILPWAAEAREFRGVIADFGELPPPTRKAIRKGLKLMCREIAMGVAVSQLALQHASLDLSVWDPERVGVVFGCDHIVADPEELSDAFRASVSTADAPPAAKGGVPLSAWGAQGIAQITPLWLLKYLPNMPASHVAIYNDLRGPSNSLTFREPSSNLAVGEAWATIQRGMADAMLAGATGSSVGPLRALHAAGYILQAPAEASSNGAPPATACLPFDLRRRGTVMGEGAAAVMLEERSRALDRGAVIYGEVLGYASSMAARAGVGDVRRAVANAARAALANAGCTPEDVGHIHAHGLGTQHADREEAAAIRAALGARAAQVPVVAGKGYWGNMGAAGGMVELIASLKSMQDQRLFPILGCDQPDEACGLNLVRTSEVPAGNAVLNLSFAPNGQASALVVRGAP